MLQMEKLQLILKLAINGKQLNDLGSKLGLTVRDNTGFTDLTLTKKLKNEKGVDVQLIHTTFKDVTLEANIDAINRGFKVAGRC